MATSDEEYYYFAFSTVSEILSQVVEHVENGKKISTSIIEVCDDNLSRNNNDCQLSRKQKDVDDFSDLEIMDEIGEEDVLNIELDAESGDSFGIAVPGYSSPCTSSNNIDNLIDSAKSIDEACISEIQTKIEQDVLNSLNRVIDNDILESGNDNAESISGVCELDELCKSQTLSEDERKEVPEKEYRSRIHVAQTSTGHVSKSHELLEAALHSSKNTITMEGRSADDESTKGMQQSSKKTKGDKNMKVRSAEYLSSVSDSSSSSDSKTIVSKSTKRTLPNSSSEDETPLSIALCVPTTYKKSQHSALSDSGYAKKYGVNLKRCQLVMKKIDLCSSSDVMKNMSCSDMDSDDEDPPGWCRACGVFCFTIKSWSHHHKQRGHKTKSKALSKRKISGTSEMHNKGKDSKGTNAKQISTSKKRNSSKQVMEKTKYKRKKLSSEVCHPSKNIVQGNNSTKEVGKKNPDKPRNLPSAKKNSHSDSDSDSSSKSSQQDNAGGAPVGKSSKGSNGLKALKRKPKTKNLTSIEISSSQDSDSDSDSLTSKNSVHGSHHFKPIPSSNSSEQQIKNLKVNEKKGKPKTKQNTAIELSSDSDSSIELAETNLKKSNKQELGSQAELANCVRERFLVKKGKLKIKNLSSGESSDNTSSISDSDEATDNKIHSFAEKNDASLNIETPKTSNVSYNNGSSNKLKRPPQKHTVMHGDVASGSATTGSNLDLNEKHTHSESIVCDSKQIQAANEANPINRKIVILSQYTTEAEVLRQLEIKPCFVDVQYDSKLGMLLKQKLHDMKKIHTSSSAMQNVVPSVVKQKHTETTAENSCVTVDTTQLLEEIEKQQFCKVCNSSIDTRERDHHIHSDSHKKSMIRLMKLILPKDSSLSTIQRHLNRSHPLCGLYFVAEQRDKDPPEYVCDLCLVETKNTYSMVAHLNHQDHCNNFLRVVKNVQTNSLSGSEITEQAKQTVKGKIKIRVKTVSNKDADLWPTAAATATDSSIKINYDQGQDNMHVENSCFQTDTGETSQLSKHVERIENKQISCNKIERVDNKPRDTGKLKSNTTEQDGVRNKPEFKKIIDGKSEMINKRHDHLKVKQPMDNNDDCKKKHEAPQNDWILQLSVNAKKENESIADDNDDYDTISNTCKRSPSPDLYVSGDSKSNTIKVNDYEQTRTPNNEKTHPISKKKLKRQATQRDSYNSEVRRPDVLDKILKDSAQTFKIPKKNQPEMDMSSNDYTTNQRRITQDERRQFLPGDDHRAWNVARKRKLETDKQYHDDVSQHFHGPPHLRYQHPRYQGSHAGQRRLELATDAPGRSHIDNAQSQGVYNQRYGKSSMSDDRDNGASIVDSNARMRHNAPMQRQPLLGRGPYNSNPEQIQPLLGTPCAPDANQQYHVQPDYRSGPIYRDKGPRNVLSNVKPLARTVETVGSSHRGAQDAVYYRGERPVPVDDRMHQTFQEKIQSRTEKISNVGMLSQNVRASRHTNEAWQPHSERSGSSQQEQIGHELEPQTERRVEETPESPYSPSNEVDSPDATTPDILKQLQQDIKRDNSVTKFSSGAQNSKRDLFENLLASHLKLDKSYIQTANTKGIVNEIIAQLSGACQMTDPAVVRNLKRLKEAALPSLNSSADPLRGTIRGVGSLLQTLRSQIEPNTVKQNQLSMQGSRNVMEYPNKLPGVTNVPHPVPPSLAVHHQPSSEYPPKSRPQKGLYDHSPRATQALEVQSYSYSVSGPDNYSFQDPRKQEASNSTYHHKQYIEPPHGRTDNIHFPLQRPTIPTSQQYYGNSDYVQDSGPSPSESRTYSTSPPSQASYQGSRSVSEQGYHHNRSSHAWKEAPRNPSPPTRQQPYEGQQFNRVNAACMQPPPGNLTQSTVRHLPTQATRHSEEHSARHFSKQSTSRFQEQPARQFVEQAKNSSHSQQKNTDNEANILRAIVSGECEADLSDDDTLYGNVEITYTSDSKKPTATSSALTFRSENAGASSIPGLEWGGKTANPNAMPPKDSTSSNSDRSMPGLLQSGRLPARSEERAADPRAIPSLSSLCSNYNESSSDDDIYGGDEIDTRKVDPKPFVHVPAKSILKKPKLDATDLPDYENIDARQAAEDVFLQYNESRWL